MRRIQPKPYKLYLYEKQLKKAQRLQAEKERYLNITKYSLLDKCLTAGKNLTAYTELK